MVEQKIPLAHDALGEFLLYYRNMIRVYIATARAEERSALRLMLLDLKMQVVGEASDWFTTLARAPLTNFNILLVDWDLLPMNAATGLAEVRPTSSDAIIVVLTSSKEEVRKIALSAGADDFINKHEIPDRLAAQLQCLTQVNEMKAAAH